MPNLQTYNDMTVELMQATEHPACMVGLAQSITTHAEAESIPCLTHRQCEFLIDAEHTSLFEHVVYTFLVQGVSRSFLAQITRQRTASPTSGSQHYQDYSDYPCSVATPGINERLYEESTAQAYKTYELLLANGVPKEEARQVLPNAACVNYLWTIDARNLFFFLRQRLCNRNVLEMRIFANKVLDHVQMHFPELFEHAGPQCHAGKCKQGFMQCKQRGWVRV